MEKDLAVLITDMEKSLEAINKWLNKSGMKMNESKSELCLFHRNPKPQISVVVNGVQMTSKPDINVLEVEFDSRLHH